MLTAVKHKTNTWAGGKDDTQSDAWVGRRPSVLSCNKCDMEKSLR